MQRDYKYICVQLFEKTTPTKFYLVVHLMEFVVPKIFSKKGHSQVAC